MYRVRQEDLPFKGSSYNFVGADNGDVNVSVFLLSALPAPDQRVPAYSTGDARIARRIGRDLELSLVGQNLFQPHHAEYAGDPGGLVGIRRSAYVKLTWTR